ncbi:MAG: Nucleoside recognition domain protein [Chthoniobacteraceae bacterium]|nr:Nucleoside recognition domain protein [Chthoniobacteraceae bacterium]
MLNWIWLSFLLIAVIVGGFTGKLPELTKGAFETAETAVMKIALPLIGLMAIWLGIMRLAERSGLVQIIARALQPLMRRLFPEVPPEHPAMGAMVMNMAANMLGLGNAATPLGLRAMTYLEKLNPNPGTATNAMCTFLAINTASIQLLPTMAISQLALAGSQNPTAIVPAAFAASCCAAFSGVFTAKLLERLPMFRIEAATAIKPLERQETAAVEEETEIEKISAPPLTRTGRISLWLLFLSFGAMFFCTAFTSQTNALLAGSGLAFPAPPPEVAGRGPVLRSLSAISILAVPFLLTFFSLYAALRKVKVYEQFVEGAKEAFGVAQRIVPFLVAMLVAVRMLREAGVIDLATRALRGILDLIHFPADLLPMVLMRPLSGSATQGIFVELINRLGPDTLVSRIAATVYGSTETTFYVLAVYFGAVAVKRTRHAVIAGLTADTVAVIASIVICRLMFA